MTILVVEPEKRPEKREIKGDLKEMQEIVGGKIEAIYPFNDNVALVYNDEGKINGLPANRGLRNGKGIMCEIICGAFFLCSAPNDGENFGSLTPEQIERYEKLFHNPEVFIESGGHILCVPIEDDEGGEGV